MEKIGEKIDENMWWADNKGNPNNTVESGRVWINSIKGYGTTQF